MKRRTLVLAGGTVTYIALRGATRRRNHRATVPHSIRRRSMVAGPLVGAIVMPAAFGWDGAGFIGSAWGWLRDLGGDIKDWVLDAINFAIEAALNLVEVVTDAIKVTLDEFGAGISVVADLAHKGLDAVGGVIADTYQMLDGAFNIVRQQIKDLFEGFWHDFKDIISDLIPDFIKDLFGDAWDILQAIAGIGWDGLTFLINLIDDPINFLWELLKDVVTDAIDTALGALDDALTVLAKIWHIVEWLASHADDITEDVLSTVWDVFSWMITHIDDFTIDVLESLVSPGGKSLMQRAADETDSEWADATSQVRKLFGLDDNALSMQ